MPWTPYVQIFTERALVWERQDWPIEYANDYFYAVLSDVGLKSYTDTAYHNEELKSLTRYRFDKVKERTKLKSSIDRLV